MDKRTCHAPATKGRLIWDCGSTLYDSVELESFRRQLESALASRSLSMPHLTFDHMPPPPAAPAPEKSRGMVVKFLLSLVKKVLRAKKIPPAKKELAGDFPGGSFGSSALVTIPEVAEKHSPDFFQVNVVRKAMSERFMSKSVFSAMDNHERRRSPVRG